MARERKFSTEELFNIVNELVLQHGYEGFTFSILAERMEVSRGVLYKYYENKDELLSDFMNYEMDQFLLQLRNIEKQIGFESKFDFLIDSIFKNSKIHQVLGMSHQLALSNNSKVKLNKQKLDLQHLDMYNYLRSFTKLGKEEKKLKSNIPDELILGIIFQSIAIPNHFGIPQNEWIKSIKEILSLGMFTNT